ncbi:hypothetical protein ISU10_19190 [Nocardioides agariphilus]|jgi:hypothetical protein|uniref:Uncharacterized protein n=1 Tax=Nocardioides agariphilus TaxID=433664 RepID=A0A930YK15_9ACTN|nr:hypothetical protein [Nocardioides agariphilus]MBF4769902.1 hypothetical protein [Nocardioides agariphilus]
MTDDTRFDARVRGALTELPVPGDLETRDALVAVLDRSRGPRRSPRRSPRTWAMPALAAAAVVALVALLAVVVDRPESPQAGQAPPPSLSGQWELDAAGLTDPGWRGRWLLSFDEDGVLTLTGPAGAMDSTEGASYAVTGDHVRVDVFVNSACAEQTAGEYRWRTRGDHLLLVVLDDVCPARAGLLAGDWTRVS